MFVKFKRTAAIAVGVAAAGLLCSAAQAVTPFQSDVGTSINNGLAYLDTAGAYKIYSQNGVGNAVGLTTLALLEKRASGNPNDPAQGYNGASTADQQRLRAAVNAILNNGYAYYPSHGSPTYFYAYFDGSALSALSEYLLTGGPDTCGTGNPNGACTGSSPAELQGFDYTVLQAINGMVDATLKVQRTPANGYTTAAGYPAVETGYWCYNDGSCTDSSTTQYAALGLSAVQAVYNNATYGDPGARLPKIQTALTAAGHLYTVDYGTGSENARCDAGGYNTTADGLGSTNGTPADANAHGHGYHSPAEGYAPSMQQTASGMFVQLLGGSDVNSAGVQAYMRWITEHYRYTDIGGYNGSGPMYNSWALSYFYYLWSSFKGVEFLIQQGTVPAAGNYTAFSYGTLDPAAAPACPDRQVHRPPATLPQVPLFGAGAAGFYSAETQSQYFDYAYTILAYQCANGSYFCNSVPATGGFQNPSGGGWATYDTQAYALLVLQRATGVILPTATLTASTATATVGAPVTLTWGSTNANSCAATGGTAGDGWTGSSLATSGNIVVHEAAAGPVTYTVTCSAGNQTSQAQVTVTYSAPTVLMCDVSGPTGAADGEVSAYDISAITGFVGKKVAPNGPAPAAADPMGAGVITVQDARACALRCTKTNCAN